MSKSNWIIGFNAVAEVIRQRPGDVAELVLQEGRQDKRVAELRQQASQAGISMRQASRDEIDQLAEPGHQGVAAAVIGDKQILSDKELLALVAESNSPPLLLVLDGVTDPQNLGACLRSADAAGVTAVVVPKDKAVGLTPTVRKVAAGAAESVNLAVVTNLARCLKSLQEQGVWIVGTDDSATTSLYEQDLKGPIALVMGSEGTGLRRLTRDCCDFLVSIPMTGALSSLNVSVATGVTLFEAVRQRRN